MAWTFDPNGGLATQKGLSAPTYKDPFVDFLGSNYYNKDMLDPALAMTLNAGGAGNMQSGLSAFIPYAGNNQFNAMGAEGQGGSLYNDGDMQNLAKSMGIDVGDKTGLDLQNALNSQLKDYVQIGGMSAGWNPTGDVRGANQTLYKRQDGQLVPIQQSSNYSAPEKGSYVSDNPWVLAPLAVIGGGLAATYLGAGAAGAGGGITGTGGASGMAAYGAGAAPGAFATAGTGSLGVGAGYGAGGYLGAGGLAGSTAYGGLGSMGGGGSMFGSVGDWYNSLSKYQQQALQGGVKSGLISGGDPRAMATGALTGGIGGLASGWLGDLGAPGWLAGVGGKLAGGLTSMGLGAALGGGSAGGAGRGSGGGSGGAGAASASGGAGGLSGGIGGPALGAARAQELAFLRDSYAPVAAEEQKRRLAKGIKDDLGDGL